MQSRLKHADRRFSQMNRKVDGEGQPYCLIYIRDGDEYPIDASPILIPSEELSPGDVSTVRIERQDFAIWRCSSGPNGERGLGKLYPPIPDDGLRDPKTGEVFQVMSMGLNEPPYMHTTSSRERLIVHTIRVEAGPAP